MQLRTRLALGLLAAVALGALGWVFTVRTDSELECLAKNIYFEGRFESELGQRLIAHVTLQRQRENSLRFGRPTICSVVYQKTTSDRGRITAQFSWTLMPEAGHTPKDKVLWKRALQLAKEVRSGAWVPEDRFAGAKWYMNQKKSARRNICWFRTTLVSVGSEGNHEFFREPINDRERLTLLASDPAECHPAKKHKKQASR